MLRCEGGTERRYRMGEAGLMQRDRIEIAFHDDDRLRAGNGLPRHIQGKKRLSLLKERRIGRFQILWRPISQHAAAESDHALAQVGNREHDPASKTVVISRTA